MMAAQQLQIWCRDGQAGFAAPAPLALDRILPGRPVSEVLGLVPRMFNLCAAAQSAALRAALDLPPVDGDLSRDILRDHLALLALRWPRVLGLSPRPLPPGWARDGAAMREFLLGYGALPETAAGFDRWLAAGQGAAPVLAAIRAAFAPGEGASALPLITPETALAATGVENSPAGRHARHPLLVAIAEESGRGPLWHAAGRLVDALVCVNGALAVPYRLSAGVGVAPASRGMCAIAALAEDGHIVSFRRVTPTDHLLSDGGSLSQALASLHAPTAARVRLLVEILDPCIPVEWHEAANA